MRPDANYFKEYRRAKLLIFVGLVGVLGGIYLLFLESQLAAVIAFALWLLGASMVIMPFQDRTITKQVITDKTSKKTSATASTSRSARTIRPERSS